MKAFAFTLLCIMVPLKLTIAADERGAVIVYNLPARDLAQIFSGQKDQCFDIKSGRVCVVALNEYQPRYSNSKWVTVSLCQVQPGQRTCSSGKLKAPVVWTCDAIDGCIILANACLGDFSCEPNPTPGGHPTCTCFWDP